MKLIASQQTSLVPPQIESVRQRLERWRRVKKHHTPIPEELWTSAAELARRYGVAKTSRALRLDYYSLKERLEARCHPNAAEANPGPAFVELVPTPAVVSECTVEWENPSGARMRIHLKGMAAPDWISLSEGFWRIRR